MPSRRQVLATLQCGLSAVVVGCQSPAGSTTTDTVADTPREDEPTATSSDRPAVEVHPERASHWLRAVEAGSRAELRTRDVVAFSNLDAPTRDAVETTIADGTYETSDPSTALLDGIDDVSIVEHEGTYYEVEHTFPTYTLRVGREIDPQIAPADRTVDVESEAVEANETVERILSHVTPTGTNYAGRPYTTTRMPPALSDFLDRYDYVTHDWGTSELVLTTTERSLPYTVTATEATDERVYGHEILEPDSLDPPGPTILEKTLERRRRTPLSPDERTFSYYPEDVPAGLENRIDDARPLVLHEGVFYRFSVSHHHWEESPVEVSATVRVVSSDNEDARIELRAENVHSKPVTLTMPGIAPFGALHAYGPDGEHLLWTGKYESSDRVRVTDGSIVAESDATVELGPTEQVVTTYELGGDDLGLESGAYEVQGFVRAEWRERIDGTAYDRSGAYPYALTVVVE